MYAYPTDFTDEMIDAIARLPTSSNTSISLCSTWPLSPDLMRRMPGEQQIELLEKLRERIPGWRFEPHLLLGSPVNRRALWLRGFVDDFGFDMVSAFQFSPEPGTPAGTLDADPKLRAR